MDLREELLKEHSKSQTQQLAKWVGQDEDRFAELMQLFMLNEYRVPQRAAWVVGHCAAKYPHLINAYFPEMIANLKKPGIHDAVKRNTIKIFQDMEIPEEHWGALLDICFGYLADPKVAVAIRVFSMTVIWNICKKEPDLMEELKLTIEDHLEYGTAGFKSRGKRILREIGKWKSEM